MSRRHLVPWAPVTFSIKKFYGDRPRETLPSGGGGYTEER